MDNEAETWELIKDDCIVFNTIIDIGCGNGGRLFPFEELGFKKLIGIDSCKKVNPKYFYQQYFFKSKNLPSNSVESFNRFIDEGKFVFFENSYDKYDYEHENYSFILCYGFLHFIPDEEKYSLIERLYTRLESGGLMYLKLNHSENKQNTDPSNAKSLGENIYEEIESAHIKRYLVVKNEFVSQMSKYPQIERHFQCDEKAITVVLKKPGTV